MINKLIHFSDLHIRLFKDHDLYKGILTDMFKQWGDVTPDRIVFTGDLVHSKNQMTPELIEFVAWVLTECSKISKTIVIIGNHDFLESNQSRFSIGKIKSKNLIFEVLSYNQYLSDASMFLFQGSKWMRRMLIENYFSILNTLIPEASSIKELLFDSKDSEPPHIPRFAVYNLDLNIGLDYLKDIFSVMCPLPAIRTVTVGAYRPIKFITGVL